MLNAGSLLIKKEELADLARQKNLDIIGVTETWLHDGLRDDEICLPGYTLFRQDRPSQKKEGRYFLLLIQSPTKARAAPAHHSLITYVNFIATNTLKH